MNDGLMLRFYMRLVFVQLIISTAALWIIRVQPYDDHGLRELLVPTDCLEPCFMGIRPGLTTIKEAVQLLADNHWVEIDPSTIDFDRVNNPLIVPLNDAASPLIDRNSAFELDFQKADSRLITKIAFRLQNSITLGDVYLMLGKPSLYTAIPVVMLINGGSQANMEIYHQYDGHLIGLHTVSYCPVKLTQLLHQPVYQIEYNDQFRSDLPDSTPAIWSVLRNPLCS